jgi:hypothetical protein
MNRPQALAGSLLALALVACAAQGKTYASGDGDDGGTLQDSGTSSGGDGAPSSGQDGSAASTGDGGTSSGADGSVSSEAGSSDSDGGSSSGADASDGGSVSPPAKVCGGQPCYTGQSCVSSACTFNGCTGSQVPGDYATVQGAVNALSAQGGTICLGAKSFSENVTVNVAAGKSLTFQGASPTTTTVESLYSTSAGTVTVKGIGFGYVRADGSGTASVFHASDCKIAAPTQVEGVYLYSADNMFLTATLDGLDVSSSSGAAVYLYAGTGSYSSTAMTVTLTNSYLHDSNVGAQASTYAAYNNEPANLTFNVMNNTFVNDQTALELSAGPTGFSASYFNNVFTKNALAITTNQTTTSGFGDNALFGNTTNYGNYAVDGTGYVKSDPKLDTSATPPALLAGSPCLRAANTKYAPAGDFWGDARGAHPDIGAVQSSH